jgi:hypothetical protein
VAGSADLSSNAVDDAAIMPRFTRSSLLESKVTGDLNRQSLAAVQQPSAYNGRPDQTRQRRPRDATESRDLFRKTTMSRLEVINTEE